MLCATSPGEAGDLSVAGVVACRSGDGCWGVAQPGALFRALQLLASQFAASGERP